LLFLKMSKKMRFAGSFWSEVCSTGSFDVSRSPSSYKEKICIVG